jgi:cytoskeleton protein RodZ
MSEPKESVGAQLRRERERQGYTVQKVAEDLRLDKAVVEALEDGTYDRTVPYVYARGHLRKYSQLLGLAIDDGQAALPLQAEEEPPVSPTRPGARVMRIAPRVRKLPWTRICIGAAIMLVLLLFWWSPWKHHVAIQAGTFQSVPAPAIASAAGDMASAPAVAPASDAAGAEPAPANAAPANATPADNPAGIEVTGRVRLHLTFSATSWVDVRDATGKRLFMGHGYANTVKSLAGKAPFLVYISSVNGVHIEVNGREVPIDPALIKGDVARFTVSADGLHPIS